ncbi:hypothetical protein, partial [Streptomyces sp. NPDC021139]|uniref:hypothetical protein n=1 Tax=Streptomyces sp. NPDC021139 TaxID=3154899 RepID=UPI003404ECC3
GFGLKVYCAVLLLLVWGCCRLKSSTSIESFNMCSVMDRSLPGLAEHIEAIFYCMYSLTPIQTTALRVINGRWDVSLVVFETRLACITTNFELLFVFNVFRWPVQVVSHL